MYNKNIIIGEIMKLKPLSDRIVVKAHEAEGKTASGIILPDTAKEKPQMGEVLAVGPGKFNENGTLNKMSLKKGDNVLYGKYSGSEVSVDGEDLMIMRESDILATL
jgi:chaperonin GroES|tara:strand:- start:2618 stop:2935 length:318 start_codon:yes stop_codon:yes gene_type:complete